MRLLVYEHLTAFGGIDLPGSCPSSLLCEGLAMLQAIVVDFSQLPDLQIVLPITSSIDWTPPPSIRVFQIDQSRSVSDSMGSWLEEVDAALIVAPELGGILEDLTRLVEAANVRNLGSNSFAIQISADKYATAQQLDRHSVPTIPTWKLSQNGELDGGISEAFQQSLKGRPVLIKPRFGAGSQEMSVHQTLPDTETLTNMIAESDWLSNAIFQPYFPSLPLSVAVWCAGNDRDYHSFPVGLQIISDSEHFEYLGGLFPRQHPLLSEERRLEIRNLAISACRAIPGLQGYVGVDLILPHEENSQALVCEINPRLTTSYLGYRTLSRTNLASQWFEYSPKKLEFDSRPLRFTCDGAIELLD